MRHYTELENAVHIIYINTGLDTKATANALVPTITCTSSNVVATVLQAAVQVKAGTVSQDNSFFSRARALVNNGIV